MRSYDYELDVSCIAIGLLEQKKVWHVQKIFSSPFEISGIEYSRGLVTCVIELSNFGMNKNGDL